jgi:patatin-related protein
MRFAIVMYGGTSLAIYINGVAQELLALVRATAPVADEGGTGALYADHELVGAERVYRQLGQMVAWHDTSQLPLAATAPIRTRFVIDVLSGTSAGGLNAIFLAKALANEQDMSSLKRLWQEQADIALLANDQASTVGMTLKAQRPPQSLLNSQRLYWQLLHALDLMDRRGAAAQRSRLIDELDCWITTTDIRGLLLPIDTFDRFVFERRHRKAFHLVYRAEAGTVVRNDFKRETNPFLAFSGRATSAFPFAFEPMQLADIDAVVSAERFRDDYGRLGSRAPAWRTFFDEYLKGGDAQTVDAAADDERVEAYRTTSFGDGGYLDNKPFTWATANLSLRRTAVPVDRRLFYVEPDPGDRPPVVKLLEQWRTHGPLADIVGHTSERPNALENVLAALLTLPRVETIREDIELLNERNRDVDRLSDIAFAVDAALREDAAGAPMPPLEEWRTMSAIEWMTRRGTQFRAYHRLHVASVLDDLAEVVTRASGLDEDSDEQAAIRCFVQAWADRRYPEGGVGDASQNDFLFRFDLAYRIRRIQFLQRRIDALLRFDYDSDARLLEHGLDAGTLAMQSDWRGLVTGALYELKAELDQTLGALRAAGRTLWARTTDNPLLSLLPAVGLDRGALFEILNGATTKWESIRRAAQRLDDTTYARFEAVANAISDQLKTAFTSARTDVAGLLREPRGQIAGFASDPVAAAIRAIKSDFDHYDIYDSIIFPIAYGSLGEADRVEVIRISPEDAPSIINELADPRRKLAGTSVNHFGGFLDERWRRNDMLWGRLDTAERIVTTVLTGVPETVRQGLVDDAHRAIIADEFSAAGREDVSRRLLALALGGDGEISDSDRRRLELTIAELQTPEEILAFMKAGYEVDRRLELDATLKTAGRGAVVVGALLDGISNNAHVAVITKWIARLGRVMWGFAELASPRMPAALLRYWAWLFALVGALMAAFGILFNSAPTTHVGWVFLLVLAGVAVTTWILRDVFARRARELAGLPRLRLSTEPQPSRLSRWLRSRAILALGVLICAIVALSVVEIILHLRSDISGLWS